jgi:hypothetical protein
MHLFMLLIFLSTTALADSFEADAKNLAQNLKVALVKQLTDKINSQGTVAAMEFCHTNVKTIAKGAAGDLSQRFEFGRTSHKWRNDKNSPTPWMNEYLQKFQGKLKSEIKEDSLVHKLADGKRVYLEPLYVQPLCLQCHGESLKPEVKQKISSLYPQDKAVGFKLNEFRGFIWVKEK